MDIKNNIEEVNKVQFINCHYRDVERYRDAFTETPDWLVNALDDKTIELKNYNPESIFDYGSYGIINTREYKKEFSENDWIIKKGNGFEIKKGKHDDDKFLNHIVKWKNVFRQELIASSNTIKLEN